MNSRDKILAAIKANQPAPAQKAEIRIGRDNPGEQDFLIKQFMSVLQAIGGYPVLSRGFDDIAASLGSLFGNAGRMVTTFSQLHPVAEVISPSGAIYAPENIDVAILGAHFGVAENGGVWMTEEQMCDRSLPFICQNLVVVVPGDTIVASMHEAYQKISGRDYGFSTFIAGPSKTADIEQSLVLGAHGPVSMTVFITT